MPLGRGHGAVSHASQEAAEAAVLRCPWPRPQRGLLQAWGPLSGQRKSKSRRDGLHGYEIPKASPTDPVRGDSDAQDQECSCPPVVCWTTVASSLFRLMLCWWCIHQHHLETGWSIPTLVSTGPTCVGQAFDIAG